MRSLTAIIIMALLTFNQASLEACDCKEKIQLDARDWNDAETILHVRMLDAISKDEVGRLTFETLTAFKGSDPGPEASINYYLDDHLTVPHELESVGKDQEWILFIEVRDSALRLTDNGSEGYCPMSRMISDADSEADLAFLADMKDGSTGPTELYYPNGAVMAAGEYEMGVATGVWKYFDYSGNVLEQGEYVDGRRDGQWDRYTLNHINGRHYVSASDFYSSGQLDAFEEFNQHGMIRAKHEFKDHGQRKSIYFDSDGVVEYARISHPLSITEIRITYHPDGRIREVVYMEDGKTVDHPQYAESILGIVSEEDLLSEKN